MFSPTLETTRLTLRNLTAADLPFVLAHFSDPEVHRYLVDTDPVTTEDQAQEIVEFYADPERLHRNRWVLVDRSSGESVGTVGLHSHDESNRKIEVGYDLSPRRWGEGLMREALKVALDHAFGALGVHRIEAFVHVDNDRSTALLERLGFTREGTIRAQYWRDGAWHDHHLYSLLSTDPPPGR
ncbi:MAG TPA: GNAT family N-acetyltransferase [Acidimicrobiia bacterium]|nr:GNAT family N-acetyltransferase [Acidimicrobiia bacterium]